MRPTLLSALLLALVWAAAASAEDKPAAPSEDSAKPADSAVKPGPLPGHSTHGEVFNEGPRQKAYLMPGMPKINFPATTKSPEAQAFINQGIGQIHGFWYYEAERSFRQAALLDKDCAMAYWGMALANMDNGDRAKKFMAECVKRKTGASEREAMYIDALDAWLKADAGKRKERAEAYTRALEKILYKYPDDLDARAFLALQLWKNRDAGIPISSHLAIDALLDQVFKADPMHPAHHYRIHLWDYERAENALASAALCGQTSPGVAHMWHMPGHIYSRTKRYEDACWQQEASARTDHAHMMRDRVLPDQIHNFAHNNEWLIRDMIFVGRMRDAIDLAKNMCELPRHPKYNSLTKGSSSFGRTRLFDALARFECWDELLALAETPYLEPTDIEAEQLKRLRYLGMAHYRRGNTAAGDQVLGEVRLKWAEQKSAQDKAMADAETKTRREKKSEGDVTKARDAAKKTADVKLGPLQKAVDELLGHQAVAAGDYARGHELLKKSGHAEAEYLARVQFLSGDKDKAIEAARTHATSRKNEVLPLATLVELLWQAGKKDDAKKALADLRTISGSFETAAPVYARIAPIAKELGYESDWKVSAAAKSDTGVRPSLDSLGPFRWQPMPAPAWTLKDADGKDHSLSDYHGKPVVVLFFLGHGCLHCAEQLHAFGNAAKDFEASGISLVAISSDDVAGLKQSITDYKSPIPMPLLSDSQLNTFVAYRCHDDFEHQALHGTFFIDGAGLVRWHDISYQPFMDHKFVLGEARRLLGQAGAAVTPATPPAATVSAGGSD
ncbi:MAG: redoxin domain-containing protein [Pirellulaceae bacterium]|nr:redoxin domain-containing protein [Pirellulaceae bacterium]